MPPADDAARPAIDQISVPKPSGGTRLLTILEPGLDEAYRRIVSRLAAVIERALEPQVVANRVAPGPVLRLEPWRRARRRLLQQRRAMREAGAVLRTDVRDCYGSIRPGVLEACLRRLGGGEVDVRKLRVLLERFEAGGVRGLPVGPEPSAVLANAVLTAVDTALQREGLRHVRWVDDVWAAAPSEHHALRALDRVREALATVGLAVAPEKTGIHDPESDNGGPGSGATAAYL